MNKEKQVKKMSKSRQEYLKFKPFADDLREAESWCELDGVLNRYQTVKNLSKMGYRKIYDDHQRQCTCYALGCQMAEQLERKVAREIFEEIESVLLDKDSPLTVWCAIEGQKYAELKKKYTESEEGK